MLIFSKGPIVLRVPFARSALRLEFGPALLAGTAFMLCGHFTRFVYMSHLNVETLLPLQLFLFHRLAEKPGLRRSVAAGLGAALLVLGGFPEAALYALCITAAYFLFETLRRPGRPGLLYLGFALALGGLCLLTAACLSRRPAALPAVLYPASADEFRQIVQQSRGPVLAVFTSVVQAFVFTLLSMMYFAGAMEHAH